MDSDLIEAVQNVVDRISSYQDGATDGTVEKELRAGLEEAGLDLEDRQVRDLATAIEADPAAVRAADVLQ